MATYTASDGKVFHHAQQHQKYEGWLKEKDEAPGGKSWEDAKRHHGFATEFKITREGNGRHRVEAKFSDGHTHTSVHPQAYIAHEVGKTLLGLENDKPPAAETHSRSRVHPIGPKEESRLRKDAGENVESEEA